jgi:uncharacterized membrane protein
LGDKKSKEPFFQVLLLDNNESLNVQVQEAQKVDYSTVKQHLKNGGSVFITSKNQQKLLPLKASKAQQNYNRSQRNYGTLIQKTYYLQNV